MKIELPDFKQVPSWIFLILTGVVCLILGAAQQVTLAGYSIQIINPYNYVLLSVGGILTLTGILEVVRLRTSNPQIAAKTIEITDMDSIGTRTHPRLRVMGKIDPPVEGITVWLMREHMSHMPGNFHVGGKPALTDRKGEWVQFVNLWEGTFRIHAVVAPPNGELLFAYYREAFEHSRNVYRQRVDDSATTFPDWPFLHSLPTDCVSDTKITVI